MLYFVVLGLLLNLIGNADAASMLESLKATYCYGHFSQKLKDPKFNEQQVSKAKAHADKLFPEYRAALEEVRQGTPAGVLLQDEYDTAQGSHNRLSVAERLMLDESCEKVASQ